MKTDYILNRQISAALVERGLLPVNCRLLELSIGVEGATVIRYERFVTGEELGILADALVDVATQRSSLRVEGTH